MDPISPKSGKPEDVGIKKRFITLYVYCLLIACFTIFCSVQINSNVHTSKQEIISKIETVLSQLPKKEATPE